MEGNLKDLENGLRASVDWLSFTVMTMTRLDDALSMLGYTMMDFSHMPKGARGYRSMVRRDGYDISVLYDGNPDMGIHVDVSGLAVGELIRAFSGTLKCDTPFGEGYDIDFDSTFLAALLQCVKDNGHVTRLDIAVDDIGCVYFTTDEVFDLYTNTQVVSKLRSVRNVVESDCPGHKTGHTVYFGSRASDIFLRVYDKRLEQNKKLSAAGKDTLVTPWVRWELELKNDRAVSVANMLLAGIDLGTCAIGVLGHYMRIINLDDSNRSRCSTHRRWAEFIAGVQGLKLYVPKYEKTLDDKKEWIVRQVMPTLTAVILADGGSLEFVENNLENGLNRMKKGLYDMAVNELNGRG